MAGERIMAPKPPAGLISARIRLSNDKRREQAKIVCEHPKPRPFNYKGIEITILSREVFNRTNIFNGVVYNNYLLEVYCEAWRNGEKLAIDGHMLVDGPRLCVPDGTFRLEIIDGKEMVVENLREDPEAALMETVGDDIFSQAAMKK